jgi:DNA polymerase-3 subunit delta
MKFVELKKNLKTNLKNNYILKGEDEYLLSHAYELIKEACNIELPELNLLAFKEDIDFDSVVKALETLPIFVERKLIYVKLTSKDFKNESRLEEYLKNINTTSVLVVSVGNTGYLKNLEKYFEIVDCNRLSKDIILPFVVNELKKYSKSINKDACELLCDYTNCDLSKITNELTKCVSYIGDRTIIEINDIMLLVGKSVEFQIFELTEALAKKNAVKVYEILSVIKTKKDEFRGLLALIYKHFRRLFMVSVSSETKSELAKSLGVHEYAITKSQEQARLFTKKQLKEINDVCHQLDYDIKQSNMTPENAIDYIVLKILNY